MRIIWLLVCVACGYEHAVLFGGQDLSSGGGAQAVAALPDGGVILAGCFSGTLVLGARVLGDGQGDAFVARLDPEGRPRWVARAPRGSCIEGKLGLALGPRRVALLWHGVDDERHATAGILFVGLDGAVGDTWPIATFGSDVQHLAFDGDAVIASGESLGPFENDRGFKGGLGVSAPYVARMEGPDRIVWSTALEAMKIDGIAVDPSGRIDVAGEAGNDGVIAQVGPDGALRWRRTMADASPRSLAVDGAGAIVVGGWTAGPGTFGGRPLNPALEDGMGAFVVGYTADGAESWAHRWGAEHCTASIVSVAASAGGEVTVVGEASGDEDCRRIGGLDVVDGGLGAQTVFVAGLGARGSERFLEHTDGGIAAEAIAVSGDTVWAAGELTGSVKIAGRRFATASELQKMGCNDCEPPSGEWVERVYRPGIWVWRVR